MTNYSSDAAYEALEAHLSTTELEALSNAALELKDDSRSARELTIEFGLDQFFSPEVAKDLVRGLQGGCKA
jgi:hypothetical protein